MKWILPASFLFIFLAACKKEQPAGQDNQPPVNDARSVLLNEVVEQSLPSPYYKFSYNAEKYVTEICLASGLAVYKVSYENKRVKKLSNFRNGRQLLYNYKNGQVANIAERDTVHNRLLMRYQFHYNNQGKLLQFDLISLINNSEGEMYKQHKLAYYADGNLAGIETYADSSGVLVLAKTQLFSGYDTHTNVDDFSMLESFYEGLLFLPQVKLQLNNPALVKIITNQNDYEIAYSYQYNNNHLPVNKTGVMIQTRGTSTGQFPFHFTNRFSYY